MAEFHRIIDQHGGSPALIMWVDQNEGSGQYDQARIANDVKAYDPSRLVDNMSGVTCCSAVDGATIRACPRSLAVLMICRLWRYCSRCWAGTARW